MITKEDIENLWEYYSEADAKANEQEKDTVRKMVSNLYMVSAALNASLAEMSRQDVLPDHRKIDFKDQLAYARSLVGVLSAYTTYDWKETRMVLDKFEARFGELK